MDLLACGEQSWERGLDAVHPGDTLVEDHGVGDDRACHAVGLDDVGHAEQSGDAGDDVPGLDLANWSSIEAARSMPFWRASAASSTARWGTETRRMRSERSSTEPSSQPDAGKRVSSEWWTQ